MKCRKCKQTLHHLMCLALMEDAGAKCYPSATTCPEGGEHDFSEPEPNVPPRVVFEGEPEQPAVFTMEEYRRRNSE